MKQTHFAPTDELFKAVCEAQDKAQRLYVLTHYASCTSGVGPRSE